MTRRNRIDVKDQLKERLVDQIAFGESRHESKKSMSNNFERAKGIHSHSTFNNYLQVVNQFCRWREEQGLGKYTNIDGELFHSQAVEYLEYREKQGLSAYTLHRDSSALNRVLLGSGKERLNYTPPARNSAKIAKGRDPKLIVKPSSQYNKEVYAIARATGLRRHELQRVSRSDFFERDNRLYVKVRSGKGGKSRTAPVLRSQEQVVRDILNRRYLNDLKENGLSIEDKEKAPLFERTIHHRHNIHALRREYANNLREDITKDKGLERDLLKSYGNRKTVIAKERDIKSSTYQSKKYDVKEDRDVIYAVSRALGHNRLDVVAIHYFN